MSEEQKHKIGISNSGRKMTKRQRQILSKIHKKTWKEGRVHWARTPQRTKIVQKISEKRRGVSFIKTIKKGRYLTPKGYVRVYFRNRWGKRYGYIFEHRLVMENYINRPLDRQEDVHHINGDKTNNSLDNLMLFPTRSAHIKFHNR